MIGVRVETDEELVASELFELFKTKWEFARLNAEYEVLISSGPMEGTSNAKLHLAFGLNFVDFDRANALEMRRQNGGSLRHGENRLHIYGELGTFPLSS